MKHLHSKTCTYEICLVGPTREQLVRETLLRRLERGEEFMHYKKSEVEAMRFAPSALVSSPHYATGQGSPRPSAVHPDETRAVRADSPSRTSPTPTGPGGRSFPPAGASEDVAP